MTEDELKAIEDSTAQEEDVAKMRAKIRQTIEDLCQEVGRYVQSHMTTALNRDHGAKEAAVRDIMKAAHVSSCTLSNLSVAMGRLIGMASLQRTMGDYDAADEELHDIMRDVVEHAHDIAHEHVNTCRIGNGVKPREGSYH